MRWYDWAIVVGMMLLGWALIAMVYGGVLYLIKAIK